MCGIVGYIGNKSAFSILIKGLHRLEYRGYDSAGVAMINANKELSIYKTKGKVKHLEEYAQDKDLNSTIIVIFTYNSLQNKQKWNIVSVKQIEFSQRQK